MRCPKCGYISFDKITSCSQCETDVTELASTLNGTGFQPMNNFFLGTLLPDYMSNLETEPSSLQDAADDLDISMEDLDNLGDIGDIPGETGSVDLGFDDDGDDGTISLQDVVIPEVDLSDFGDELDSVDTMQISGEQLDEIHAQADESEVDLGDIPDFDLDGVDLEEEAAGDGEVIFSEEELAEVAESVEDMPSLDLEMEGEDEGHTEILSVESLELEEADELEVKSTVDLGEIDLSLGEEEADDTASDLADLDLGDLEMESDDDDLPDLKL